MEIMFFLLLFGPPVALTLLGIYSIYLTFSGNILGRSGLGWIVICVALAVFIIFGPVFMSKTKGMGGAPYLILLGVPLALQGFLFVELVSQKILGNRSSGLKILKSYSAAENRLNQDDLPGAIAEYEKVLSDDRGDVAARLRLAELYVWHKDYRKAAETYGKVLKKPRKLSKSEHCTALTRLAGICAEHLGDKASARRHLQSIIDTYPDAKYAEYAREYLQRL